MGCGGCEWRQDTVQVGDLPAHLFTKGVKMKIIEDKKYYSVYDIAYKLDCSPQTIRNKIKEGKIKGIILMGIMYITKDEYLRYIEKGD